jgi:hypothetical protein
MSRKNLSSNAAQRKGRSRATTPAKSKKNQGGLIKTIHPADTASESAAIFRSSYFPLLIIFGLAAIAGTVIMYQATIDGVGITTDSIVYIKVARNLLGGHGFALSAGGAPLTQYPPLYPATLALTGLVASDLLNGVKWLHIFLYVANALLVGLLVYRGTEGSIFATIAALLFMLTSGLFFHSHVVALSEVLFVFFVLTGLLLIDEYLCRNQVLILIAASIVVVLAGMTRYVGFILLGVVSLCIVLLSKYQLLKRIIHAGIVIFIFITPMLIWMIRNMMISNSLVNRNITYHPVKFRQIEGAVATISSWFFIPTGVSFSLKAFLIICIFSLLFIILVIMIRQFGIYSHLIRIPLVCTIFLFLYTLGLIAAILFVEANLPFSHRMLFPFYVVLGIASITLGRNAFHLVKKPKWPMVLTVMVLGAFLIAQGKTMAQELRIFTENGEGFTGKKWKSSKAMEFIRRLPDNTIIYSNGPEAIEFLTGRQTKMIPSKRTTTSNEQNVRFSKELAAMMRDLVHSKGYLVYFDLIAWRGYIPAVEELNPYGKLESIYRAWDGTVYQGVALEH